MLLLGSCQDSIYYLCIMKKKENEPTPEEEIINKEVFKTDPVVQMVIAELQERSRGGIDKYGTTLQENELSLEQWLQHAKEEAMDQALYLQRSINEIRSKKNTNK